MSEEDYEPEYEPELVQVGNDIRLEILAVVPPPLEYIASLHSKNQEISGRQIWTGSLTLAYYVLTEPKVREQLVGKRILELGSGTGLLGMALSKMCKPLAIVLTDGDGKAIELMQANLRNAKNNIDEMIVRAVQLAWGGNDAGVIPVGFIDWCRSFYCFWSNLETISFDFIFAGDVLYKRELPSIFFETVQLLLHPDGCLWLCHVPRNGVTQECVVGAARDAGLSIEKMETPKNVPECPVEDVKRAVIYRIRKDLITKEKETTRIL